MSLGSEKSFDQHIALAAVMMVHGLIKSGVQTKSFQES
jgi:ribosome-associated protein YbcJ (S4-like RNA binding protein)